MSTFGQKENKGIKIIHDLHRAAKNDKKDQVIVCVQIHRQTSKADLLKSRKKKCIYVATIALLSIWVRRYHLV